MGLISESIYCDWTIADSNWFAFNVKHPKNIHQLELQKRAPISLAWIIENSSVTLPCHDFSNWPSFEFFVCRSWWNVRRMSTTDLCFKIVMRLLWTLSILNFCFGKMSFLCAHRKCIRFDWLNEANMRPIQKYKCDTCCEQNMMTNRRKLNEISLNSKPMKWDD